MKYNDNGTYKDIYVKSFDTLPVGAIVEFDGSTIPDGWTDIGNNQIKKTSQYIEGGASLSSYFTDEIDTGMKWIDGKPIYRKVIVDTLGTTNGSWKDIQLFSANYVDTLVNMSGHFKFNNANKTCVPLPYTRVTDASYSNREYVLNNFNSAVGKLSIIAYHPNDYDYLMAGQQVIIILEYTKTTD